MKLSGASRDGLVRDVTASVTSAVGPKLDELGRDLSYTSRVVGSLEAFDSPTAAATQDLRRATAALERARDTTERVAKVQTAYRMAMLAVPYAVAVTVLAMLVVPIAEVVGIGPLSRWAWASFEGTGSWGTRAWIAVLTLTVVGGAAYAVYRAGQALVDAYQAYYRDLRGGR